MAKYHLFGLFIIILLKNSDCSDSQFLCGASKSISKCSCAQETDRFENIPLFNIDCSRVDLKASPSQEALPLLMGHLDVSHNKISFLNHSVKLSSTTLYYLDFSYNQIKFISDDFFNTLTQLINLNLGHNKLEKINSDTFNGLTKLKVLNLQWNKFKILPEKIFLSLYSLEDLTLSYNNIGTFIQKNGLAEYVPSTIKNLYLDKINLTMLHVLIFEEQKHLKKLSIAYNPLNNLTYLPLTHLEYLDISGTNVSNITVKDLTFHNLKILKMNRLPYLTKINDYTFYNLRNLEELYIEHCIRFKEMDPLSFGYRNDNNFTNFKKFSVAYSGLTSLPNNFQSIFENMQEIHLRGNFWNCDCKLSWFKYLKNNVKNSNQIRCNSPESEVNKTVHSIAENLPCLEVKKLINPSPYRPTQTWLFPVVGVLTIIVIILVSILIYMGPYNSTNSNKTRYIGPDSPYNPITIQPNQAEYYFHNSNI